MKSKLALVLTLAIGTASPITTLASDSVSSTDNPLLTQSEALILDVERLSATAELNRFEESIIDRKNDALRQSLSERLTSNKDTEINKQIVASQLRLMQDLLAANEQDLKRLSKESKQASDAAKDEVQFAMQKRITTMDEYYADLSTTLTWASDLGIDTTKARTILERDLKERADFLYNSVLYLDSQLNDVNDRLAYLPEEEKAALQKMPLGSPVR